jgi:predicted acylesterase/phospholipase RssA
MKTSASTTDLQGSFETRAASGHFLDAGERAKAIGLALSGGGTRAIAFHLGCFRALNQLGLLDHVAILSTVSGGSVIGAYFHAHRGDFASFEAKIRELVGPMCRKLLSATGIKVAVAFTVVGIFVSRRSPGHLVPRTGFAVRPSAIRLFDCSKRRAVMQGLTDFRSRAF